PPPGTRPASATTATLLAARQEYFAVGGVSFCADDGRRERRPLAWRQAVCLYPGRLLVALTDGASPPDVGHGSQAAIRNCRACAWHVAAWHVAVTKCTSWLRPSWEAPFWRAPKSGLVIGVEPGGRVVVHRRCKCGGATADREGGDERRCDPCDH